MTATQIAEEKSTIVNLAFRARKCGDEKTARKLSDESARRLAALGQVDAKAAAEAKAELDKPAK